MLSAHMPLQAVGGTHTYERLPIGKGGKGGRHAFQFTGDGHGKGLLHGAHPGVPHIYFVVLLVHLKLIQLTKFDKASIIP